jgi:hypothetical protein
MRLFFLLIELANVVTVDLPHDADPTLTVQSMRGGGSAMAFFDQGGLVD